MTKGYFIILALIVSALCGTAMADDVEVKGYLKLDGITFTADGSKLTKAPIGATCISGYALTQINSSSYTCQPVGSVTSISAGSGLASTGGVPITTFGTISIATGGVMDGMLAAGISASKITGNISGNAGNVTGTVAVANGGTGAATASAALSNLGGVSKAGDTMSGNLTLSNGNLILPATTATTGIIYSGSATFIHSYGTGNFFAGPGAGNLTTIGYGGNTAIGVNALNSNTYGDSNTASGYETLSSNTYGNSNTAIGYKALSSNTFGSANTASGYHALHSNTTGNFNTANGTATLSSNSTGGENTAIGESALNSNTSGSGNTATGSDALLSNTTGDSNTASGEYSLSSNDTGYENTAIGALSLYGNTSGYYNTALGVSALYTNRVGNDNTAVGYEALLNSVGNWNTAIGLHALKSNTSGGNNVAVGLDALTTNSTGSNNTAVGTAADVTASGLSNATAIGFQAKVDVSNKVMIGNNNVTWIGGYSQWQNISDMRAKKDIEAIHYGIDFIKSLRPVQFQMASSDGRINFGFVAQDIETLLGADYGILGIGGDKDRTMSLSYTGFIAPMVKAMQEQQAVIEAQKCQIRTLEERLSRLETLVSEKVALLP